MSRCSNDLLISKVGIKPLNKTIEVDFSVLTNTESCVKINTRDYLTHPELPVEPVGTPKFNQFLTPPDMFACLADGCKNSGTLMLHRTSGPGVPVSAQFINRSDATEFAAGVITYYAYFPTAGRYHLTTRISDVLDLTMQYQDVYFTEVDVPAGFYPVIVDLSKAPQSTVGPNGNGWTPTERGITVLLEAAPLDSGVIIQAGFSSIFIYNSIEDFQVNDTVKVGCIDEFSGEFTLDARDASCFGIGYDPASIAIERTITGRSVTANYWKLNPLTKKGELTDGWLPRTVELPVVASDIEGYGMIYLPDMNMDECGFLLASVAHGCVTEGMLSRVNTPTPVELESNQFIVLDPTVANQDEGVLLFNEDRIGLNMVISYPQRVTAEHFVGNASDLDARRVRMSIVKEQTDGVKTNYVYNNVLVTSFPDSLSDEETTFDFTISVQRDRNGNFYEMFRVID